MCTGFTLLKGRMGWAIAIQGGAGDIARSLSAERKQRGEAALHQCLSIGISALRDSRSSALDVAELVVRELENNPNFNAGKGSVLTTEGTIEMEASIMDGRTKNCGVVAGVYTVVNPISLARLVMEKTPHIFLAFDGAEKFAREQGVETADMNYFITKENVERLQQAKAAHRVQVDYTASEESNCQQETVGCVVVDSQGSCAAATSTGGIVNKMAGRIGDTPIIGAGTYANHLCAVSATGRGETIIRATVARDVAAHMEHKGSSLKEAADYAVRQCTGGLVAVSYKGEVAMPFTTSGMFRACAKEDGFYEVGILN